MLYCFGPVRSGKNIIGLVRSGENIIGSVRGRGHKICYFSVRSGLGQMVTGHYGIGVPKTLPRRTLISNSSREELQKLIFRSGILYTMLIFVTMSP